MKRIINRFFLFLLALLLAACGGDAAHEGHTDSIAEKGVTYTCPMHPQIIQEGPGSCPICGMDLVPVKAQAQNNGSTEASIMLSDTQIKLGNISTRAVQTGQIENNTELNGRLVVDQTQADIISSRAAGRIERLYVKESGRQIKKGQPLYDLYSESLLTLEQEYLLALDQVQAFPNEQQFASILEAAKQKLLLMGLSRNQINRVARSRKLDARITFLAPASGTVTEIATAEGMYVAEGTMLYRVSRLNTIWVEAELYAGEANTLQVGTPIEVRVPGSPAPIQTKISFINPEFRQNSQIFVARAAIPNPEGRLIPGTQASISLPSATQPKGIVLPLEAVIRDAQGAHVWVKTATNTFASRMVTLGEESPTQVTIESGLNLRDTVVVTGAYLLYSEYVLKQGNTPMAGHNH